MEGRWPCPAAPCPTHLQAGLCDRLHQKHLVRGPLLVVDAALDHRGRPGGRVVGRRDFHSCGVLAGLVSVRVPVLPAAGQPSRKSPPAAWGLGVGWGGVSGSFPLALLPSFRFRKRLPGSWLLPGPLVEPRPAAACKSSPVPAPSAPSSSKWGWGGVGVPGTTAFLVSTRTEARDGRSGVCLTAASPPGLRVSPP